MKRLKQRGTGIIEYCGVLAFICVLGLGFLLSDDLFGGVNTSVDNTAKLLAADVKDTATNGGNAQDSSTNGSNTEQGAGTSTEEEKNNGGNTGAETVDLVDYTLDKAWLEGEFLRQFKSLNNNIWLEQNGASINDHGASDTRNNANILAEKLTKDLANKLGISEDKKLYVTYACGTRNINIVVTDSNTTQQLPDVGKRVVGAVCYNIKFSADDKVLEPTKYTNVQVAQIKIIDGKTALGFHTSNNP